MRQSYFLNLILKSHKKSGGIGEYNRAYHELLFYADIKNLKLKLTDGIQ